VWNGRKSLAKDQGIHGKLLYDPLYLILFHFLEFFESLYEFLIFKNPRNGSSVLTREHF